MKDIIKKIGGSLKDIRNSKYSILTMAEDKSVICKVSENSVTLYDFKRNSNKIERSEVIIRKSDDEAKMFASLFKESSKFRKITPKNVEMACQYKEVTPLMISSVKRNIKAEVFKGRYYYEMSYDKKLLSTTAYFDSKMNSKAFIVTFDLESFFNAKIPFVRNIEIVSPRVNVSTIFTNDATTSFPKSYRALVKKNSWELSEK